MGRVTFSIFNREFQFISEKDDDQKLEELANQFQEKIELLKNDTKEVDPLKLLVFLSINLLNENKKLKLEIEKNDFSDEESKIIQIIEKIKKITKKE